MAVTISPITEQNIVLGTTNYELQVQTTGVTNTMEIIAEGDWIDEFYHTWDQNSGIISIKNDSIRALRSNQIWVLNVMDGNSIVATRSITWNVIPAAPVISAVNTPLTIFQGSSFSHAIPVSNNANTGTINGPLVGMKLTLSDEQAVIEGRLPTDATLDIESFNASLEVSNLGGEHQRDIPFNIESAIHVAIVDNTVGQIGIFNISVSDGTSVSPTKHFNIPASYGITAIEENKVYLSQNNQIRIIDVSGADNSTPSPESPSPYTFPSWPSPAFTRVRGITKISDNKIAAVHIFGNDRVGVFNLSTNSNTMTLENSTSYVIQNNLPGSPGIFETGGLTKISDNHIAITVYLFTGTHHIAIFDISSGLSFVKWLQYPTDWTSVQGVARITDTKIAVCDNVLDKVGVFDISGANESTLVLDSSHELLGWGNSQAITRLL